ncbi:MAG: O-antigen ligase family protein [Candidatus Uhrbacteria bacterium]|nr:O-antigen ligase family protein [Candidatus Uhrbacteria bacterium]
MKKYLLWIIRICSALILLLPLYVDGSTIYPYTFSKIIVFQLLVELSIAAYILLQFRDVRYRVDWKNRLIQAQSLWMGVLVVSSFISVDVMRSWWSTAQWTTGTIVYIHFFAWFLVLAAVFKEWKEWRVLFWTSVVAAVIVSLLGLGQMIGIDASHYDPSLGRIYSTLGNPIYLALYLLLSLWLAGYLCIRERGVFAKIILGFFGVIFAGTLFFTGTRSAVLTLIVSLVVFLMLLAFGSISKKHRVISLSVLGVFVTVVVSSFLWLQTGSGTSWARDHVSPFLQRVIYQTFQDPARVELSHIALQGFTAKPLFGWGPNNYSYIFSTYVRPQDYGVLFPSTWYDQAHNQVINVLATSGVVGMLAYLLPWIVAGWLLWKKFLQGKGASVRIGYVAIILFFFSYFLQNLTAFDTPGPLILLYLVFAFVVFLTRTESERKSSSEVDRFVAPPLAVTVPLVVICLVITVAYTTSIPFMKARDGKRAIDVVMHDYGRGFQFFQNALSGSSFTNEDVRNDLARAASLYSEKYAFPNEQKKELLAFAIEQMEKSVVSHPYALEYGVRLLSLYRSYARFEQSALLRAEGLAQTLIERYSRRRDVLFEYVFIELELKKYGSATEYAQKIIDLDPGRADAHWWMAQVLAVQGDPSRALDEIDKARKLGYLIFKDVSVFIRLALRPSKDDYKRVDALILDAWFNQHLQTLDLAEAAAITQTREGRKENVDTIMKWLYEKDPVYAKRVEEELKSLKK